MTTTIVLALAASLFTQGDDLRNQIGSRYRAWDDAYMRHDVKALAGMLHTKFRLVAHKGRIVTRQNYVSSLWRSPLAEKYETTLLRTKRHGRLAIAWTQELSKASQEDARTHKYRDTWAQVNGHWLLMESRTLEED